MLAQRLSQDRRYAPLLSFAGRTEQVRDPGAPFRVGGFGGVDGLAAYIAAAGHAALIDATHPFAAQMSRHAAHAAQVTGTPLLRVECPAWRETPGDRWTHVPDMASAAAALGRRPRRVFLSIGRLEIPAFEAAPQHDYLIRAVDMFAASLPRARVIAARGPFSAEDEQELLEREKIDVLVSKNAGTLSTYGKIEAARTLGLPVVMVARPELPSVQTVQDWRAAVAWVRDVHHDWLARRGV